MSMDRNRTWSAETEENDMVGRKTFRNLGERVRNAMNIRRGGGV